MKYNWKMLINSKKENSIVHGLENKVVKKIENM